MATRGKERLVKNVWMNKMGNSDRTDTVRHNRQPQIRRAGAVQWCGAFFSFLIVCLPLCGPALRAQQSGLSCCADTVIGFDDLPVNASVNAHYHAQGVDFGLPPYSPGDSHIPGMACCFPITRAAPSGHSSQVANISISGGEFTQPGMFGTFTSFHGRVQVTVGDFAPGETASIRLSGYNVFGSLVAQSTTRMVTGGNPPVTLIATDAGATASIAYFVVQAAELNKLIWVDDLTFDNPRTPAAPDFALDAPFGIGGSAFWVTRGSSEAKDIPIRRFNGSNGNIHLITGPLPPGLTATFAPNPVPGTGASTTMTLSAAPDTPLFRDAALEIIAGPADTAVGQHQHQVQVIANVFPQFTIYVSPDPIDLLPCTPVNVSPIYVTKGPGFTDAVLLTLRVSNSDGSTSDLPAGLQANFSPSAVLPQGGVDGVFGVTLTSDGSPGVSGDLAVVVQGTSGPQSGGTVGGKAVTLSGILVVTAAFTIHTIPAAIDEVIPSSGRTPQALQPGTQVLIKGRGFCADRLTVGFDGLLNEVNPDPDSFSNTEIRATVPRFATTGKITLLRGHLPVADLSADFTVDTYRNTAGFSFKNYSPHITFDQMTATFGRDQTYDSLLFFDIRDPVAMLLNAIANDAFSGPGGGACFGFLLASQRFLSGRRSLGDFSPGGARTIWALDAPDSSGGPSGSLTEYINSQQVAQMGTEFLAQYLAESVIQSNLSSTDLSNLIRASVRGALASGDHPLILVRGDFGGHVLVAYDICDQARQCPGPPATDPASNQFFIYVYDPNTPYLLTDNTSDLSSVVASRIDVTNDTWKLLSSNFSGSTSDLIVISPLVIPLQPTMPANGLTSLIMFSSAGPAGPATRTTQLSDGAGHSLFGPSGKLNGDAATRLQATPFAPFLGSAAGVETFLVAPNIGPVQQTVQGTAAIPDHHTLIASDFVAQVDTDAMVGVSDQISFDPAGGVGFRTEAARKALTAGILTRSKAGVQSAELTTTGLRNGADEFRFDQTHASVIFHHVGTAVPFRLRLASLPKNASPVAFESGPLQIGTDETATFSPADWSNLGAVPMTLRGPEGQERRTILRNYLKTIPLGRIVGLDVDDKTAKGPRTRSLEIASRLGTIPAGSQVAVAWTVTKAGRTVAHESRTLGEPELHAGLRRDRFIFAATGPGRYTVRADLVVVTMQGVIPVPSASMRSASLVIR
jgi:hypothetical protein